MFFTKAISIAFLLGASLIGTALDLPNLVQVQESRFDSWVANFQRRARMKDITNRTFEAAFAGVEY